MLRNMTEYFCILWGRRNTKKDFLFFYINMDNKKWILQKDKRIDLYKLKEKYKEYLDFKKADDYDEEYKFDFFKNNQINLSKSTNIGKDFKIIRKQAKNLIPRSLRDSLLIHLSIYYENKLKQMFANLYNENKNLFERINKFKNDVYTLLENDNNWKNKELWKIWFWDASFLLALYDYKKYIFINPITPFNNFMKEFELDNELYKIWDAWIRYENWLNLINKILMPELLKTYKNISLLDIQDFVFCSFWWYNNITIEFKKRLNYTKPQTKFILWILIEAQINEITDENWYVEREYLANEFSKVAGWTNQNTSQYFSHDFDESRTWHLFLQKAVSFLPKWANSWAIKTHYKVEELYLDFLFKNLDKLKKWNGLLWINYINNMQQVKLKKKEWKLLDLKKQIILYWPPWTGKTYGIKSIIENHSWEDYNDLKNDWRVEFITFHQSFSYEEFIEWIKPDLDGDGEEISYKIEDGIF